MNEIRYMFYVITYGNCVFSQNKIVAQINSHAEMKDYDDLFLGQTVEFLRQKIYYKSFILDTITSEGILSDSIKQAIDLYKYYESDLLNNYKVRYPDLTFEDTLTLRAGSVSAKLIYMGKGHGDADVAVYIPEEKVVCTGVGVEGLGIGVEFDDVEAVLLVAAVLTAAAMAAVGRAFGGAVGVARSGRTGRAVRSVPEAVQKRCSRISFSINYHISIQIY